MQRLTENVTFRKSHQEFHYAILGFHESLLVSYHNSIKFSPPDSDFINSCSFSLLDEICIGFQKAQVIANSFMPIMHAAATVDNEEFGGNQLKKLVATPNTTIASAFRKTLVSDAKKLTDGFDLSTNATNRIILPFIGYGTYKLGKEIARSKTLEALRQGYRCIDTAFIYGGETTEKQVGLAIQGKLDGENFGNLHTQLVDSPNK